MSDQRNKEEIKIEVEEEEEEIERPIIVYPKYDIKIVDEQDGSRLTEKNKLRLVPLPKQNFSRVKSSYSRRVSVFNELDKEIKETFDLFCDGDDKVDPNQVKNGLRSVGYHLNEPHIYRLVEDICTQYDIDGKPVTFFTFMNHLNDNFANPKTRDGCNKLFSCLADEKQQQITDLNMHELLQELGEKLSLKDVKYMLDVVSNDNDPYINQDEFYYLLTKTPEDAAALTSVTKTISR
jgi:Ca2+-binding EF-hand superfamily protein